MKTKLNIIVLLLSVMFAFAACSNDMEFKDVKVTPVNKLYSPNDDKGVELLASASASLFFEWEASKAEDSGAPLYEVIFDQENGDFSNPVYRIVSDDMGTKSHATISHKDLNKIWSMAGIDGGKTGTLKWTVVSSRGLNSVIAKESRLLTVTRLKGFAELPSQLFITGEATEGGTDFGQAIAFSSPAQGEYEIFTKLEAGKTYKFIDNQNAQTSTSYYINNGEIKLGDGTTSVEESGIYCISLDFNVASSVLTKITKFGLFYCWDGKITKELNYVGKGIWSAKGVVYTSGDDRYKFQMDIVVNGESKTQFWGPVNDGEDARPGGSPAYFNMKRTNPSDQWANKWKFDVNKIANKDVTVTVSLTANGAYTHSIE